MIGIHGVGATALPQKAWLAPLVSLLEALHQESLISLHASTTSNDATLLNGGGTKGRWALPG